MRINKTNLEVYNIISTDKTMPLLNNVHFVKDGSTIASNAQTLVCVSPSDKNDEKDITINSDTIKEVLKALPSNIKFTDQNNLIDIDNYNDKIRFSFSDGERKRTIDAKKYNYEYINYKKLIKRELNSKVLNKIIINKKRLFTVLQTLEKIIPEKSGEFSIYIEITKTSLIIKTIHPKTDQNILAIMLLNNGEWIKNDYWNNKFSDKASFPVKILKRKKLIHRIRSKKIIKKL